MTEKTEKTAADYYAEQARASVPKRVAELSELEKAALGPAAVRAMKDSEQAREFIAAKHKTAAEAAAAARAVVATLPEWITPKAISWDHKGQKIEVEADHAPLPLSDGRILLRLTRRAPRPTPGTLGNKGPALMKLGADSQTLEPCEQRWVAVSGLFKVPAGKSVVIWALHRPQGVALSSEDLSKGFTLDCPRQLGPGYEGEALVHFHNDPQRILQLAPGHFIAVAELVDA